MIWETGLEAGDAIYCERSCFKASSGDHPRLTTTLSQYVLYSPTVYMQAFFPLALQNLYKSPLSGRKSGNSHEKSTVLQTKRSLSGYKD
jgi:hypothetical protein